MYFLEQNLKYSFLYTKTVTISLADTFRSSTFFSSEDDFFLLQTTLCVGMNKEQFQV